MKFAARFFGNGGRRDTREPGFERFGESDSVTAIR